jgi:hypothetical protein
MLVAQMNTSWMLFAGCALLTVILLRRVYRRMGRRQKSSTAPIERIERPKGPWDGAQRDALAQVERQKVEMHEMSRDLNGQLSSRILVLEKLIGDSQRQIERLEKLLAEAAGKE